MPIDNRTTHLNLPLPHKDNLMDEDVQRLIDSLNGLDAAIQQSQQTQETNLKQHKFETFIGLTL